MIKSFLQEFKGEHNLPFSEHHEHGHGLKIVISVGGAIKIYLLQVLQSRKH